MTIIDEGARALALDPLQSFCVSAPAGSGKTELLIQRYLALLSRVENPQQVLAITFTRKAAAEMRERVLQALQDAADETDCDSAHQQQTRKLALQALQQNHLHKWNITSNVAQLNIKTIDSFCGFLTRQMPIISDFGGQANVTDYANELYEEAVQELFKTLDDKTSIGEDLSALMLHFDNDWSRLQELLVAMLARREQWGNYLGVHHQASEAEDYLQQVVLGLVEDALTGLATKLQPWDSELLMLENYSAKNLSVSPLDEYPTPVADNLAAWRKFRQLLLTADKAGKWRLQVNVRMGFPPGKGEAQDYKDRLKTVIMQMKEIDGLLEEIVSVSALPEIQNNSASWKLVLHLSRILPMLSAQLLLVFTRRGTVDHTQVALSALQALGADDKPTELALRLDYQLQHILVDEFQDTAINQFELVRRLTRGWGEHNHANPGNPRSIMIVGDGMQSIYGFRNANVGLFLRAREEGFNGVALEHLNLLSNFRSDEGIVEWVNNTFSQAFPAVENISKGQVSYTSATAVKPAGKRSAVGLHAFNGDEANAQEIEFICEQVQHGIADSQCNSIAILARTRGHLQGILERFKKLDIACSAHDIDSLANSHIIVDLLSLCRVLINPADSVAWMAVLRAPWCGLTLADLHLLGSDTSSTGMWQLLANRDIVATLSSDGQLRLSHMLDVFGRAQGNRDRLALRVWVEQLWLDLSGPGIVETESQLEDAERFFQLLEQADLECKGMLKLEWLQTRLQRLYVKAENPESKVQVMTLHKAKGLEFDWVIIPCMAKTTRRNTRPLLNWDEHTNARGERGFLLAANDHSTEGESTLYNYLEIQRGKKELEETTRLLYVGATRAISHLILTAVLKFNEQKELYNTPSPQSLLGRMWPMFRDDMTSHTPKISAMSELESKSLPFPSRLTRIERIVELAHLPGEKSEPDKNMPSRSQNRVDRAVGTVVHLAMEELSMLTELPTGLSDWAQTRWSQYRTQFELRSLGVSGALLEVAVASVEASIKCVLDDESARWLLQSSHSEAHSEFSVSYAGTNNTVRELVIDRTFIDAQTGIRWLIDYKNSQPDVGESHEDFFARQESEYHGQLSAYKNVLSNLGPEPILCALYFTALGYLHTVESLSDRPTR